ncbi:porin [Vibrio sp. UCD-FRSSP16_10]|uniref:porin n=1 Tax=unclassified Vibrio TaxID=2614977 RepID=UPI0007FBD7BA|nr:MULTISPECIES: porin [unclassified Vibrio]OBT13943.1 porin [Vibrio sp. UCD-FRSSP16_30]OBT22824.1 porin [Vibrio sp. UCD-FRSSP16_10]
MKKTLLALTVASLAATSVNAAEIYKSEDGSVDFYGQLRQELKFKESNDHKADLSSGSSRTGINASYALSDSVVAIGNVELGIGDSGVTNRYHWVGVDSNFGSLTFGKQITVADDVYGADYSYFFGGSALLYTEGTNDSLIKYKLDGENLWVQATYALNNDERKSDRYEVFAGTAFGDLSLHAGVGYEGDAIERDEDDVQVPSVARLENTFAELTAEYAFDAHKVGFTYYFSELADQNSNAKIEQNGFSLAGKFQVVDKTALYGGAEYVTQDAKNIFNDGDSDGTLLYVGVEHKFNSWARIYAEYGYGDGTTLGYTNKDSDNSVGIVGDADGASSFAIGARVYW